MVITYITACRLPGSGRSCCANEASTSETARPSFAELPDSYPPPASLLGEWRTWREVRRSHYLIVQASVRLPAPSLRTDRVPPVVACPTNLGDERVSGLDIAHLFEEVGVSQHWPQGARTCQN